MEENEVKNEVEVKETLDAVMTGAEEVAEKAEEAAVDEAKALGLSLKEQIKAKVLKIGAPGALVEIGKENPALLHISQILRPEGKENCTNTADLLNVGDEIDVWVRKVKDGRVEVTMIKPLALEWREIKKDMVVKGIVQRMEKFGAFVEIGAERPGLIHISEMAHSYVRQPSDILKEGDEVEAMVLEVNKRRKQIKLSIKALQPEPEEAPAAEETAGEAAPRAPRPTSARAQQLKEGKFNSEPREKRPSKRNNRKREELNNDVSNFLFTDESAEGEEMTAMEIAWRSAQEKAKSRSKSDDKKKKNSSVQEDILSRTLNNKIG